MTDNHASEHSKIEPEGRREEFDLIKLADTHDLPLTSENMHMWTPSQTLGESVAALQRLLMVIVHPRGLFRNRQRL